MVCFLHEVENYSFTAIVHCGGPWTEGQRNVPATFKRAGDHDETSVVGQLFSSNYKKLFILKIVVSLLVQLYVIGFMFLFVGIQNFVTTNY